MEKLLGGTVQPNNSPFGTYREILCNYFSCVAKKFPRKASNFIVVASSRNLGTWHSYLYFLCTLYYQIILVGEGEGWRKPLSFMRDNHLIFKCMKIYGVHYDVHTLLIECSKTKLVKRYQLIQPPNSGLQCETL